MIQLSAKHQSIVENVIKKQLTTQKVFVFGSRARNEARKFSDLDLCIAGEKLSFSQMAKLKGAFSESDLPYFVDVLQEHNLSKKMFESIRKDFVELEFH
ncbi:hypothetical protein A9Q82_05455 [Cycloclasticus sp. 46_120_T64]|nr:hypothetical protein A9Q82_05455 [Cycloclasticus sp. 46_120_T64]